MKQLALSIVVIGLGFWYASTKAQTPKVQDFKPSTKQLSWCVDQCQKIGGVPKPSRLECECVLIYPSVSK